MRLLSAIRAVRLDTQQSHVYRVTGRRIPESKHVSPVFRIVTDSVIGLKLKSVTGGMDVCCIVQKSADNANFQAIADLLYGSKSRSREEN